MTTVTPEPRARERARRARPRTSSPAILVAALALFAGALVWGRGPVLDEEPAAASEPSAVAAIDATLAEARANAIEEIRSQDSAERAVDEPAAPVVPGDPIEVPDARAGDLRFDAEADVLPVSYDPAAPIASLLDLEYGPDPAHHLDLHLPEEERAPVVVYLHSGGWIGGDENDMPDFIARFAARGYAIASVDYRIAPEHPYPAPIDDAQRAIQWLKAFGNETGLIDSERVVLAGASAGGHIAAIAAADASMTDGDPRTDASVVGIVSAVGPTDLVQMYDQRHEWARGMVSAHAGCFPCSTEELAAPSLTGHLHDALPPSYWIYGALDPLVDLEFQGLAAANAWAEASGDDTAWIDIVDEGDHSLDESNINLRALDEFVDRVTQDAG